jgi:DNA repair protein RecO (recombination protein O)
MNQVAKHNDPKRKTQPVFPCSENFRFVILELKREFINVMPLEEEKTEGIVLRAFDYKDRQKIVTLFTLEAGMISLIMKGFSRKNYRMLSLSTPLSRVEVHFKRGKSDLFRYIDGTVLDEHLELRKQLDFLQTAGSLAQTILQSQLPGKSAPSLYQLFRSYLKQVPTFSHPQLLLVSFHLKLLRHEGLLALSEQCSLCSKTPARRLLQGESICSSHSSLAGTEFSTDEWALLNLLESASSFSVLRTLSLPPHFPQLIAGIFQDRIRQDSL